MLPVIFTPPPAAAAVAAPSDGTYTYQASLGGTPIGKTVITVKRSGGVLTVSEAANASVQGSAGSAKTSMTLSASLVPTAYAATYAMAGRSMHDRVVLDGASATETTPGGTKTFALQPETKQFVILDGSMLGGFFILPAQLHAWNDPTVFGLAPMYDAGVPISPDAALTPDRPAGVPPEDVALSVTSPVAFTEWYDPRTMLLDEMSVPAQSIEVERVR